MVVVDVVDVMAEVVEEVYVRILSYVARENDGPRKSN